MVEMKFLLLIALEDYLSQNYVKILNEVLPKIQSEMEEQNEKQKIDLKWDYQQKTPLKLK